MERQEVKERENIKMLHDAYSLVLSFGDIEKAKSIKKEIEKEKEKLEGTIEKIQRLEKYETEERDMLENELNYNINNTLSQERNETIQRLEKHETEERDMLEDELNYNINNTLSQEGNNRLGILMQKGKEKETMFTTPITSSPIEYPEDLELMPRLVKYTPIQEPIQETIQYSGPRVYTGAPTYETAPIQYIHSPQQYRLNTATSSITQITPQPISEIRHIINKVAAGTQTQPLGISNMDEIKNLIKKYPDMKDIIVNSLLSELVKNKNVKEKILKI